MSHREASWHEHIASQRASAMDVPVQGDPGVALARESGGMSCCGIDFPPPSIGSLLAMQMMGRMMTDYPLQGAEEVAVMAYCLRHGEDAFRLVESGQLDELIGKSRRLVASVPLDQLAHLAEWCGDRVSAAFSGDKGDTGDAKKKGTLPTGS